MNAQLAPIEEALTRAGIAYQVRGVRFYDRPEVKAALAAIRGSRIDARATGRALAAAIRTAFRAELGHEPDDTAGDAGRPPRRRGPRASCRARDAPRDRRRGRPRRPAAGRRRGAAPSSSGARPTSGTARADGVNLLTYHRAKGLEWDAVFLPMLEDGTLPIRQAFDDDAALAEERRLLYVGITRARRQLHLSWADRRETRGREARRTRSRFLAGLRSAAARPRSAGSGLGGLPAGADPRARATGRRRRPALRRAPCVAHRAARARSGCRPTSSPTTRRSPRSRPRGRRRLAALERVKGIGPAKLDKYGADILRDRGGRSPARPGRR